MPVLFFLGQRPQFLIPPASDTRNAIDIPRWSANCPSAAAESPCNDRHYQEGSALGHWPLSSQAKRNDHRAYSFLSEPGEEIVWTLNKFNALPFTQQEVVEFKNENMAWYSIIYAIKAIVEDNISSENKNEDEIVRKFPPNIRKIYEAIIAGGA